MNIPQQEIDAMRSFNRFYTVIIGIVDRHILESPYSLVEVRILHELRHTPGCTARGIMKTLNIDEGYLSRILKQFIKKGLVKKTKMKSDGRAYILELTKEGKQVFARLNDAQNALLRNLLQKYTETERREILSTMKRLQTLLSANV